MPIPPVGTAAKAYEVYIPSSPATPQTIGSTGTVLPQFTGNVYTQNSLANPNLEFSIDHFSKLYLQETGHALTPNSVIYVGGFAGSTLDFTTSKAFIPSEPVTISLATSPNSCPPASPPIVINPHEHRVDRHFAPRPGPGHGAREHPDLMSPDQSRDGHRSNGALPIAQFTKRFPHSEFLNETFVFVGKDISLPAGYTTATFTAQTYAGQQITSSKQVLNIPFSAKVPGRLHS